MQLNIAILFITITLAFFVLKKVSSKIFASRIVVDKEAEKRQRLQSYNKFIRDSTYCKSSVDADQIIQEMIKEELQPDSTTFNTLVQVCVDHQKAQQAIDLLEKMEVAYGVKPDQAMYQIFSKGVLQMFQKEEISGKEVRQCLRRLYKFEKRFLPTFVELAAKTAQLEIAVGMYERMGVIDLQLQQLIVKGAKHSSLENCEKFHCKIVKLFSELVEARSFVPDEALLNSLIEMCLKAADAELALQLKGRFAEFGLAVSSVTYGILMKGLGSLRQFSQTISLYEEMHSSAVEMNEITLGCLIDSCVKCDCLDKALEIVERERRRGVVINTIIYTTLIKGYTKQRNMNMAWRVFEKMKQDSHIQPNTVTYNSMLECAVQAERLDKMKEIFEEAIANFDAAQQADLITYSTYIKGLCKLGKIKDALKIYNTLRDQKQYALDEVLYNSILDGLFKHGDYVLALEIFQKMREDKIIPSNVTYSILIKLYSAMGEHDRALRVLQEMREGGIEPGLIVYTCLVQTCVKIKNMTQLLQLYSQMRAHKVYGDTVFYNTIISGLMFNHLPVQSVQIAIEAFQNRIKLNAEVCNNLLHNLSRLDNKKLQQNEENILQLLTLFQKNSIQTDLYLYNTLMRKLLSVDEGIQPHDESIIFNKARTKSQGTPRQQQSASSNPSVYRRSAW